MKFHNPSAGVFVPDGTPVEKALQRTTHMGIGAHQDDLEFMATHGILECFHNPDKWFCGVTVTDGRGSPRTAEYSSTTDDQMKNVRREEQDKAAQIGEYGAMVSLDYPSASIKQPNNKNLLEDLKNVLTAARPEVVYTHNLADKHDTHIAVAVPVIRSIRALSEKERPKALYGCEVWRALDWVLDDEKIVLDVSANEKLIMELMGVFDSQISGGKRYDQATIGRKRANATYYASHKTDRASLLEYAMDLTPLIRDPKLDIADYVAGFIERFKQDVAARIRKQLG
jgi:LmbE family N-acetylglucosaminyl deacetylase